MGGLDNFIRGQWGGRGQGMGETQLKLVSDQNLSGAFYFGGAAEKAEQGHGGAAAPCPLCPLPMLDKLTKTDGRFTNLGEVDKQTRPR